MFVRKGCLGEPKYQVALSEDDWLNCKILENRKTTENTASSRNQKTKISPIIGYPYFGRHVVLFS